MISLQHFFRNLPLCLWRLAYAWYNILQTAPLTLTAPLSLIQLTNLPSPFNLKNCPLPLPASFTNPPRTICIQNLVPLTIHTKKYASLTNCLPRRPSGLFSRDYLPPGLFSLLGHFSPWATWPPRPFTPMELLPILTFILLGLGHFHTRSLACLDLVGS